MKPNFLHIKSKYYPIGAKKPSVPVGADDATDPGSKNTNTGATKIRDTFLKSFGNTDVEIFDKIKTSIDAIYKSFDGYSTGLNKTNALQEAFNKSMVATNKSVNFLEENEKQYIKTLGIGTKDILRRRMAYLDIQQAIQTTNAEMTTFMETMEKSAPLYGKLMAEMAKGGRGGEKGVEYIKMQANAMKVLTHNTTLTAEQMDALNGYSAASGTTLGHQVATWDKITESVAGGMDKSVAFQMITEGIAEAGADIRGQYGKLPGAMESAILKSKKLGLSLKELNATGESLLDIESSVSNELEYQQLSGKRLVDETGASLLNMYREATLSGNADAQADAMGKILETQEDILAGNNMYAKKSLAANLNMTVEQLMAMREQKKLQDQINDVASKYSPQVQDIVKGLDNIDPSKFGDIKMQLQGELTPEDFKAVSDAMGKITESNESQLSPAEKIQRFLEQSQQTGILVNIKGLKADQNDPDKKSGIDKYFAGTGKDSSKIKELATDTTGSAALPFNKFLKEIQSDPALLSIYGQTQMSSDLIQNAGNLAKEFADSVPVLAQLANVASSLLGKVTDFIKTKQVQDYSGGLGGGTTTGGLKDAIIGINDGVISVNDGIAGVNGGSPDNPTLSFNENDKLTVVAGPYGSINDRTAENLLAGQSGPTSVMQLFPTDMVESIDQNTEALTNLTQLINDLTASFELTSEDMQDMMDLSAIDETGFESIGLDELESLLSGLSDSESYDGGLGNSELEETADALPDNTQSLENLSSSINESVLDNMQYNEPELPADFEQMESPSNETGMTDEITQIEQMLKELMGLNDEQYAEFNDAFYDDWQEGMALLAQENPDATQQELEEAMLNGLMETIQEEMGMSQNDMDNLLGELEDAYDESQSGLEYPEGDLGNSYQPELENIVADDVNLVNSGTYDPTQDIINAIEYGFSEYSKNVTALDSKIIEQAIYDGMKQVTIIVNLDPMAVHKEIEFRKG